MYYIAFIGLVLFLLLLDLGVFHRRAHAITVREALTWTAVWIGLALVFNVAIFFIYENHWQGIGLRADGTAIGGGQAATEFLSAFVLEKSLSLDNLFVIALIFSYFGVSPRYQHRVLFWGILGALVLRGVMIAAGAALFGLFVWVNYVFGALLIYFAFKMLRADAEHLDLSKNPVLRFLGQLYPVSKTYEGGRFFTRVGQLSAVTPLFVVLLVIESSDVMFAFDSIPAAFGVSNETFVIFSSNIFAVLGLRSLYFVLSGIVSHFKHLKFSLFLVLMFVGIKMLLVRYLHIDMVVSLGVILGILSVGILASTAEQPVESEPDSAEDGQETTERAARPVSAPPPVRDLAIQAVNVTRFYGRHRGIIDLSLAIPHGAIVGLLGPNGAGKTTAIRILTCHMPPTSGSVRICGYDTFSHSLEVRKRLGYLPENCPLYPEMRVIEYLRWTAQMKGTTGSMVDKSVFDILEACHIDHVRSQMIGTLSKGYRQRVGLAAALVHKPDVVILDEPTIGLDPLQAREFRRLIGALKGRQTILISSHILSEIDVLCDSVVILHEGSVVASGSPQKLRENVAPHYTVECRSDPALKVLIPRLVHGIPNIALESYEENDSFVRFRLTGSGPDPRLELFRIFAGAGVEIRELTHEQVTLEDVFLHYTQTVPEPEKAGEQIAKVLA